MSVIIWNLINDCNFEVKVVRNGTVTLLQHARGYTRFLLFLLFVLFDFRSMKYVKIENT